MSKKSQILKEVAGIESTVQAIRKKFGDNSVMWFGESVSSFSDYDVMETGLFNFDVALGNHGIVKGRFMEIYGPESSGKTTLMLHLIRQAQRLGGVCAFVDAEHALDPVYATNMGIDLDSLLIAQPDSAEETLDIVEQLIQSNCFDFVVLDSIGALVTREELEKGPGDATIASLAKILTPSIKKINSWIGENKTIFCAINQERDKISLGWGGGGGGTTQPGGRAPKFVATYRMRISRIGQIKKSGEVVGIQSRIKLVKNKASAPFKECDVNILFHGEEKVYGIWEAADIFEMADQLGLLEGKTVRKFDGERLDNGEFNSKLAIHNNTDIRNKMRSKLRGVLGYPAAPAAFNQSLADVENSTPVVNVKSMPEPESEDDTLAQLKKLEAAGIDISSLIGGQKQEPVQEENKEPESQSVEQKPVVESKPVESPKELAPPKPIDFSKFLPSDDK